MSTLRVEFLFEIGQPSAPLPVTADMLGRSYRLSWDGTTVEITFPTRPDDWLFWQPPVRGGYRTLMDLRDMVHRDEVAVYIVRVAVELDAGASAMEPLEGEAKSRVIAAIDRATAVAEHVMAGLTAWIRSTTRLTDLPLTSDVPPLAGPVRTVDIDSGHPVRIAPSISMVLVGRDPDGKYNLAESDMDRIIDSIERDQQPPVAETLLADAEYYIGHKVRDYRRAILMAAIACEVKVKAVLRQRATDAQRPLLDFALDNPREITITAADGLFDKLMLATLNHSLRKEDKQLFNDVQSLYRTRNAIAHHGRMPNEAEAGRVVRAARRCFIWLDGLE